MKSTRFPWALCVAAMVVAASVERASATPIGITFTGIVTESNAGTSNGSLTLQGPAVGDTFTGQLIYQLDPSPFLGPNAFYARIQAGPSIPTHDPGYAGGASIQPFTISGYGDFQSHNGGFTLNLSSAGEVVGGSIGFGGRSGDVYGNFRGVINSAPDASSSLALMLVGLVGLAWFRSRALPKSA